MASDGSPLQIPVIVVVRSANSTCLGVQRRRGIAETSLHQTIRFVRGANNDFDEIIDDGASGMKSPFADLMLVASLRKQATQLFIRLRVCGFGIRNRALADMLHCIGLS